MRTFLISILLLFSFNIFSQTYVSDYTRSYLVLGEDFELLESYGSRSVFSIRNGYLVWESEDDAYYTIKKTKEIDGIKHYYLEGRDGYFLLFSVNKTFVSLIFDGEDGNRYLIKFYLLKKI